MSRRSHLPLIASLLAAACLGAGGGALLYSTFGSKSTTNTVVHQVTVPDSQPTSSTSPLSINEIYRRTNQGIVKITVSSVATTTFGGTQQQEAQGSGWVYDANGDIVTDQHVIAGARSIKVTFWNGKTYAAKLVGADGSTDLAVVKASAPSSLLHPLSLGDSSKLAVGDGVVAIGSPFGLSETVTSGIVSALHRTITSPTQYSIPDSIQTDAAINHGNSGGALLNLQGQVVGVTAQISSSSGGNEGVGFAIPSNTIRSVAPQLISTGKAQHAYLGISLDSTAENALVAAVRPGTPAAKADLRGGDVITSLGSARTTTPDQLASAIAAHKPGDKVTVTFTRNGQSHTVTLTLASRPS
ncbi:MAG: S1C family serine protease [Gaiellaceae bacterium]